MAYNFTDWEHCTDPNGNARTLDWSEDGMRGQPPGLYLEALRQAAVERSLVALQIKPKDKHDGDSFLPHHNNIGYINEAQEPYSLKQILEFIESASWGGTWYNTVHSGWINPSNFRDIHGQPYGILQYVMDSDDEILDAIGQDERIQFPSGLYPYWGRPLYGPIPGAYLRQLRDVLNAKVVFQFDDPGYHSVASKYAEVMPPNWESYPALRQAFSSVPWGDPNGALRPFYIMRGGTLSAQRTRFSLNLLSPVESSWYANYFFHGRKQPPCKHVSAYLFPGAIPYFHPYFNPDYPDMLENQWYKVVDDQEIQDASDSPMLFDVNDIPSVIPMDNISGRGVQINSAIYVADYRDDFTFV